jgi:hypothetical protein
MKIEINPANISTATGDTFLDVDTGSFGDVTERLQSLASVANTEDNVEENSMLGFVYMGNDTYLPADLHKARRKKHIANSRDHTKRTYNSVRQLDRRYRNVTPAKS